MSPDGCQWKHCRQISIPSLFDSKKKLKKGEELSDLDDRMWI